MRSDGRNESPNTTMKADDLLKWIPLGSALAAIASAVYAGMAAARAARSLRLSERQEDRRRPRLTVSLSRGLYRDSGTASHFAFLLSVSNLSDTDNAVARVDLQICYRTSTNFMCAVDIPSALARDVGLGAEDPRHLVPPVRVDAHQTVTGWVYFRVDHALLEGCRVDKHRLFIVDSHTARVAIDSILQEVVDAAVEEED